MLFLDERPLSIVPWSCSPECALRVTFHPSCGFIKYTALVAALSPTSAMGMPVISPGASQAQRSQDGRSFELKSGAAVVSYLGPTVGVIRTAQVWPGPTRMHASTKHMAAKARPSTSGAPAVPLDILHVLNSQSWWRRCNSVSVPPWIEISFPVSKVAWPWDSAVISAPRLCVGPSPLVSGPGLPRWCWWLEHQACLGQSLFWKLHRLGGQRVG